MKPISDCVLPAVVINIKRDTLYPLNFVSPSSVCAYLLTLHTIETCSMCIKIAAEALNLQLGLK